MSELIQKNDSRGTIRWKLLTGVSALALTAYISSADLAKAEDAGRPQIWLELGGQLSSLEDRQETFAPDFPNSPLRPSIFSPSQKFEYPPRFSIDEDAKISFQPDNSDWIISASLRYGRSSSSRHVHQQTTPNTWSIYFNSYGRLTRDYSLPLAGRFADTNAQTGEKHLILDFQAGKDVGLGMFGGKDGSSVLGLGIRFAQFTAKSNIALKSDPDWHFSYKYNPALLNFGFTSSKFAKGQIYHSNSADLRAQRNFRGVGPSLSWSGSASLAGNPRSGDLSFDWGLNAAALFGRQRTKIHQQIAGLYHSVGDAPGSHPSDYHPPPTNKTRSRTVIVPNIGGFAGASWRIENFKVSAGYRADFFFGAMDGGIDAAKKENIGFFGPFASISVGLGD